MPKIDKNDQEIIDLLVEDSKRTVQQIAQRLKLPPTTVHNRIKRLEQLGVITQYAALIDWNKVGKSLKAFVLVSVEYILPTGGRVAQEDVAREIKGLRGVEEVDTLTGVSDLLVKVRVKDIAELNEFIVKKLRGLAGVDKTQTMIVLSTF